MVQKQNSAVTLLLSSDVSCASRSPSPVVSPRSCNGGAESARESDAAQKSTVSSLWHLVGHKLNCAKTTWIYLFVHFIRVGQRPQNPRDARVNVEIGVRVTSLWLPLLRLTLLFENKQLKPHRTLLIRHKVSFQSSRVCKYRKLPSKPFSVLHRA